MQIQGSEEVLRDAVMKEAMRLFPANGVPLERIVPRSGLNVRGHHIPEGTIVGVSPYAIHRDPEIYGAQVDKFCPERWLEPDVATKNRMEKHYLAVSLDLCRGLSSLLT